MERWAAEYEGGDSALRFFIGAEGRNAGFFLTKILKLFGIVNHMFNFKFI